MQNIQILDFSTNNICKGADVAQWWRLPPEVHFSEIDPCQCTMVFFLNKYFHEWMLNDTPAQK